MAPVVYRIRADDRICHVNAAWCEEAEQGGIRLASVFGRVLWDCFSDATTVAVYQAMVGRVRAGNALRIEVRCDLPDERRWFELGLTSVGEGAVEFVSTLQRAERRPAVALLMSGRTTGEGCVRMCSWCQQIAVPDGRWLPVGEAMAVLGFWGEDLLPRITHGICGRCSARVGGESAPR